MFRRIAHNNYTFPDDFADSAAKDLIKRLLHSKRAERLGTTNTGGFETIKNHPFFESIDWDTLVDQPSPFARYFETDDSSQTKKLDNF